MSRGSFVFGLLLSVAVHAWLLMLPARGTDEVMPIVVPIVETELARVEPPRPEPPVEEPGAEAETRRAPEPEPTPQPAMEEVAEADETETDEPGDLAGDSDGRRTPSLRINWGTGEQALATVAAGEMIIVILGSREPSPVIRHQVSHEHGAWLRGPYQPAGATVYSNRLRIVDHVPAFEKVRRAVALGHDERLAILVPMRVERVLEAAQMEAAFNRGLVMQQVENFAGHFSLGDGTLAFDITHIGASPRSAMP